MLPIQPKAGRPLLGAAKRLRLSMTLKPELVDLIEKKSAEAGLSASRMTENLILEGLRSIQRKSSPWEARTGVNREQVRSLCQALGIRRLALFGSVLTERFGEGSDIDLLVEFQAGKIHTLLDRGRVQMEFEKLFGRRVDLAELRLIDNPIRRKEIASRHEEIYAA